MKTAMSAANPSGMPIAVPRMVGMGRLLVDSLVALSSGADAVGLSIEWPDEETGAAVINAVLTTVETTPSEFEVIVVKLEVALTKIRGQPLISSEASKLVETYALVGKQSQIVTYHCLLGLM